MSSQDQEGVLCEEKALLVRKGSKRNLSSKSRGGEGVLEDPSGFGADTWLHPVWGIRQHPLTQISIQLTVVHGAEKPLREKQVNLSKAHNWIRNTPR